MPKVLETLRDPSWWNRDDKVNMTCVTLQPSGEDGHLRYTRSVTVPFGPLRFNFIYHTLQYEDPVPQPNPSSGSNGNSSAASSPNNSGSSSPLSGSTGLTRGGSGRVSLELKGGTGLRSSGLFTRSVDKFVEMTPPVVWMHCVDDQGKCHLIERFELRPCEGGVTVINAEYVSEVAFAMKLGAAKVRKARQAHLDWLSIRVQDRYELEGTKKPVKDEDVTEVTVVAAVEASPPKVVEQQQPKKEELPAKEAAEEEDVCVPEEGNIVDIEEDQSVIEWVGEDSVTTGLSLIK